MRLINELDQNCALGAARISFTFSLALLTIVHFISRILTFTEITVYTIATCATFLSCTIGANPGSAVKFYNVMKKYGTKHFNYNFF